MQSIQSCETLLQLLLLTRLEEGFTLVPVSQNTLTFYKEFSITGAAVGAQRMLSSMQCVVFFANPSTLIVEVWVEPQLGSENLLYILRNPFIIRTCFDLVFSFFLSFFLLFFSFFYPSTES